MACSVCFGYLEKSCPWLVGCSCVAVEYFWLFCFFSNLKKGREAKEPHAAYILFYISCTVSCSYMVDSCVLSNFQDTQGHIFKPVLVDDFLITVDRGKNQLVCLLNVRH